jgi:hypothetical protein
MNENNRDINGNKQQGLIMLILKRLLKRLAIWAAEIISQAVLIGLLLIGLFGYDQHAFGKDLLGYAGLILIMFFLTGYLATTAIARAVWRWRRPWLYSVIASALFLIHFEVLSISVGGAYPPRDRVRIRMAGACIAFLSTLAGTAVLQRWTGITGERSR